MGRIVYEPPTATFPYRVSKRLVKMARPGFKVCLDSTKGMPQFSPWGIRKSALNKLPISERVREAALPSTRRLLLVKKLYKPIFSVDRLEKMDRLIEQSNATPYAKLANITLDLKALKEIKKRRGWSESDWSKHLTYINSLATPKKEFQPEPVDRGPSKALNDFQPRLDQMAMVPEFRQYRRLSKESWYRDPQKVTEAAKKYIITDRVKKLAAHRVIQTFD